MEPREFEIMRETFIARTPREVGSVTPLMDKTRDLFELKANFGGKLGYFLKLGLIPQITKLQTRSPQESGSYPRNVQLA